MAEVILVVHLLVVLTLIALVLLQRSEGGLSLGGDPSAKLFSARGTANFLTRCTAVCAAIFFATSLTLAYLSKPDQAVVTERLLPQNLIPSLPAPQTAPDEGQQ